MHLLAATPGQIEDGQEPVDLGQTPADLLFISAADTELAALSQARSETIDGITLRLASLLHLRHPMSVDLHLETCATKCKLVVVRVLGGRSYWAYGLTQYAARLGEAGVPVAFLPGDDKPDAELRALSTLEAAHYEALWAYLVEGGPQNALNFLRYAQAFLQRQAFPAPAQPLLKAGLYWPGAGLADMSVVCNHWTLGGPVVPLIFYRALVQGGGLAPINDLIKALRQKTLNPLPIFVTSLKDPLSVATLSRLFADAPPHVILNATAFAVGTAGDSSTNPLTLPQANEAPVLQVVFAGSNEASWAENLSGLSARDIAMNVALPEVDGRVLSRAVSFKDEAYFDPNTECTIATYKARDDRITFVAELAARWAALRAKPVHTRKVALILANYPNRDGRLANGVGLDTPASTCHVLKLLDQAGYCVADAPQTSDALMAQLMAGPTNWLADRADRKGGERLSLSEYTENYESLPLEARRAMEDRWGLPQDDPFCGPDGFALGVHRFGNIVVGLQPARGYNIDPSETYHAPDLVPPHNYLAFYFWLRAHWGADALVHLGKHGNLEWLPGKALALSDGCWPEIALGPMPHVYPFIVNDPGEGTQAKRRAQAVIIDHLTPPMTRAETYGPLRTLERLVDEYYEAASLDPRRSDHLRKEILSLTATTGLDSDIGMGAIKDETDLAKLDAYLCELKEAQIRDGLHVFGCAPPTEQVRDLTVALLRIPRGDGQGENASLLRTLAEDFGLAFDPLDVDMALPWQGKRPAALAAISAELWRTAGDTVERLELYAQMLVDGVVPSPGPVSEGVMKHLKDSVAPRLSACGPEEGAGLLRALEGRFVAPGASGAPTRGRLDVLPTGRNFYSIDSRSLPTQTAWTLGWKSANVLIETHLQREGDWPRSLLLTAWGTSNMRTGGDDIAQALALMGVKPTWEGANGRVTGFDILPLTVLGRPRVDVTLRVSGFFRDAFPHQIALIDSAARAIQALDEPAEMNPAAARAQNGETKARVYGSKPGAYGAGLQAMIDERLWENRKDLADVYLEWGSYAYGAQDQGRQDRVGLEQRLSQVDAVVQNQDNREHDLLDSDDYYQFEGGAAAAVADLQGQERPIYHNDHSRPERPVIRTLDEEIGRVVRSRVVNPKWIEGVKRHGYKGAFEIAATVDYLFAFAATTQAVKNHHFDLVESAFLENVETRAFIADHNAPALIDIAARLDEAITRGLWQPRSNSARMRIQRILENH